MARVDFKVNQTGMNRVLKGRGGPVQLHIANIGRQVEGRARALVPVVSGDLKRSIHSRLEKRANGEWGVLVWSDIIYATWIHDGQRFDPRSGKVIRVKVGPRPFLLEALASTGLRYSRRV